MRHRLFQIVTFVVLLGAAMTLHDRPASAQRFGHGGPRPHPAFFPPAFFPHPPFFVPGVVVAPPIAPWPYPVYRYYPGYYPYPPYPYPPYPY
jgi:hypothetical protein